MFITQKITVPAKYAHFASLFLKKLTKILPKQTSIIKHAIKLVDDKPPPEGPIYSPRPVKLKSLKIYLKINLTNGFIQPSKYFIGTSIFLFYKLNSSLLLYVNYNGLNNLQIKN